AVTSAEKSGAGGSAKSATDGTKVRNSSQAAKRFIIPNRRVANRSRQSSYGRAARSSLRAADDDAAGHIRMYGARVIERSGGVETPGVGGARQHIVVAGRPVAVLDAVRRAVVVAPGDAVAWVDRDRFGREREHVDRDLRAALGRVGRARHRGARGEREEAGEQEPGHRGDDREAGGKQGRACGHLSFLSSS